MLLRTMTEAAYDRPPPVEDPFRYSSEPPPEMWSPRLQYWVLRRSLFSPTMFGKDRWRPNRHIRRLNDVDSARRYGIYVWEWVNMLGPILRGEPLQSHVLEWMQQTVDRRVYAPSEGTKKPRGSGLPGGLWVLE
jgi:hypothetical protein